HRVSWRRRDGGVLELSVSLAALSDATDDLTFVVATAGDDAAGAWRTQLQAYARDVRESFVRGQRGARELEASYLAPVRSLATASEAKDGLTGLHIRRVHALGLLLARAIVPDEAPDPQMSYGFLLHDIGKLTVPDAVLNKPGPLTDEEWVLMRQHPTEGV